MANRFILTLRRDARGQDGVAAVEMALCFVVLLAFLLPMIDVANIAYAGIRLNSAARTGAQYAMSYPTDTSGIQSVVKQATNIPQDSVTATVSNSCECDGTSVSCSASCSGTMANFVTITAAYSLPMIMGYPGFANPYPVSKQVVVRTD